MHSFGHFHHGFDGGFLLIIVVFFAFVIMLAATDRGRS